MPLFHYFRDKYCVYGAFLSQLCSYYFCRFSSFCQFLLVSPRWCFLVPILSALCLIMSVAVCWCAPLFFLVGFIFVFDMVRMVAARAIKGNRFLLGFVWGFVWVGGVLFFPLFPLIAVVGVYPVGTLLLVCVALFSFYGGVFGGLLWWVLSNVPRLLEGKEVLKAGVEMVVMLLFFRFILYDALRIFDLGEGFFFLHPLAPFMESPVWRRIVVVGGEWGALFFLCLCFLIMRTLRNKRQYGFFLLFIGVFSVSCEWPEPMLSPFLTRGKAVVCLPSKAFSPCTSLSIADAACLLAGSLPLKNQALGEQFFVFPESAFPVEVFPGSKAFCALESLSVGCGILCGCYWRGEKGVSNAAVYFCNGVYKGIYCKRHGVPFVERLPWWCQYECVKKLLQPIIGDELFVQGGVPAPVFERGESAFTPLLCSELFSTPIDVSLVPKDVVIVGMVNDAWWFRSKFSYQLWRVAAVRALAAGRPFLYVSYERQGFFDGRGGWLKL